MKGITPRILQILGVTFVAARRRWLVGLLLWALSLPCLAALPYKIPVLVLCYYPVKGSRIDIKVTGDWGETLAATKAKTARQTAELIQALEDGSRYHGYKDPKARPSLKYEVLKTIEVLKPLPTWSKPGHSVPMTDYKAILDQANLAYWVEQRGVKEVWIWGYHGGKVDLWESNMAGPHGDISNSDRDPQDLPVLRRTYTVYHYNYQRGTSEATEDHIHQIEHLLNFVDGRDRTPHEQWSQLLFWGRFVGSDASHKIVRPGCGWAHYPPNGERDYDWANSRYVESDIEDWRPDGSGARQRLNCQRWGGDSLRWFVLWMQSLPGHGSGLKLNGQRLRNWWAFVGDFDQAMAQRWTLMEGHPGGPLPKSAQLKPRANPKPQAAPRPDAPPRLATAEGLSLDRSGLEISRSVKIKPGRYVLTDPEGRGAVRITGDNVVVDFQGAQLVTQAFPGPPQENLQGVGLEVVGRKSVTIKNAVVEGFCFNIRARDCVNLRLENCRASYSRAQRISRDGFPVDVWLALRDLGAWRNYGAGLWLEGCQEARVRHCSASAAQNGLVLVKSRRCAVTDNDFSCNSGWNVALWQSSENEISWNHLDYGNRPWAGGWGGDAASLALVNESHRNYIVGNSLTHGGDGLFLTNRNDGGFDPAAQVLRPQGGSDGNIIAYNDGSWAQANAFEGTFSRGNVYYRNQANGSNYGFWLGVSSQSWVLDNDIRRNRHEGIAIEQGRGTRIQGNRLVDTAGTAIHLWAVPEKARAPFPSTDLEIRDNLIRRAKRALDLSGSTNVSCRDNKLEDVAAEAFAFRDSYDKPSALERFRQSPEYRRLSAIVASRPTNFKFWRDLPGPRGLEWLEPGDYAPRDWRGQLAQIRRIDPGSCEVYAPDGGALKLPDWLASRANGPDRWILEPRCPIPPRPLPSGKGEPRGPIPPRPLPSGKGEPRGSDEIGEERSFQLEVRNAHGRTQRFPLKLWTTKWRLRWFAWGKQPSRFEDARGWAQLFASKPLVEERVRLLGGDFSYRSPRPGVPDHDFALLATTRVRLAAGTYRFSSTSDDGLRVFLDGKEIISRWNHHGPTPDEVTMPVKAGVHDVRVEYCQADGAAVLRLQWTRLDKG